MRRAVAWREHRRRRLIDMRRMWIAIARTRFATRTIRGPNTRVTGQCRGRRLCVTLLAYQRTILSGQCPLTRRHGRRVHMFDDRTVLARTWLARRTSLVRAVVARYESVGGRGEINLSCA